MKFTELKLLIESMFTYEIEVKEHCYGGKHVISIFAGNRNPIITANKYRGDIKISIRTSTKVHVAMNLIELFTEYFEGVK